MLGTADMVWNYGARMPTQASYGINGWTYDQGVLDPIQDPQNYFGKHNDFPKPALTPDFFDEIWIDTWPYPADTPPNNLYTGGDTGGSYAGLDRECIARHGWSKSPSLAPTDVPLESRCPAASTWGLPMATWSWPS